jgi:phospholipase/carboxylesterase
MDTFGKIKLAASIFFLILTANAAAVPITKTAPFPMNVGYIVDLPDNYDSTKLYPLIVVLHGFGDRMSSYIGTAKNLCPDGAIGLYPESPFPFYSNNEVGWTWEFWGDSLSTVTPDKSREASIRWILQTIDLVKKGYPVDPAKVFLTGFSQGGMLTYTIGLSHPELFRGLIPIGGFLTIPIDSIHPIDPKALEVPILILHGANDDVVEFKSAVEAQAKLKQFGIDAKLQRYPAKHQITKEMTEDARDFIYCQLTKDEPLRIAKIPKQYHELTPEEKIHQLNFILGSGQPVAEIESDLLNDYYAGEESPPVRERIIYLLGALRCTGAESLLTRMLSDKREPPSLRQASYAAMIKLATETAWQIVKRTPRQLAILEVVAGSPGEKVGLKPGDIIISYNRRTITDNVSLREALSAVKPGKKEVVLVIRREGKPMNIKLAPGRIGIRLEEEIR